MKALITGASSGIGRELARIHAKRGGDLILVARRGGKLEEIKVELEQKYGITVTIIVKDLSMKGAVKELYDELKQSGDQVDYLINNAGFGLVGKFDEIDWQQHQQMINLNMTALSELMYLFLPEMIKRNNGKILNVSSTASLVPGPLQAVYFATKAYVTSLSNAIFEELRNTNVTVAALMPGPTETEFGEISGMDQTNFFNKTASARKVAQDGYNGMLRGKVNVVSGLTILQKIMLSFTPFMPMRMILRQVKKMQEVKKVVN